MSNLTRWETMQPGRELDRLIALRLGLEVVHGLAVFWNRSGVQEYVNDYIQDDDGKAHPIPEYSTDVNAAVSLFSIGYPLDWNLFSDTCDDVTCEVGEFDRGTHDPEIWHGNWKARSLHIMICMAICRAFLAHTDASDHPQPVAACVVWPGRETVSANSAQLAEIARLQKANDQLQKENDDLRLLLMAKKEHDAPYLIVPDGRTISLLPDESAAIVHWLATGSKDEPTRITVVEHLSREEFLQQAGAENARLRHQLDECMEQLAPTEPDTPGDYYSVGNPDRGGGDG